MKKVYRALLIGAIILSLTLTFIRYDLIVTRFVISLVDLGSALIYYFKVIFLGDMTHTTTVNELPKIDLERVLGFTLEDVQRKLDSFGDNFFVGENFAAYNLELAIGMTKLARVLTVILPVCLLLFLCFNIVLMSENTNHGKKTKPLQVFLNVFTEPYRKTKNFLRGFWDFASDSRYLKILKWIWIFNLNILAMVFSFLGFYFYFAASVSFGTLLTQFVKLFIDLLLMFSGLPFVVWLFIGLKLFDKWRRSRGLDNLRHHERMNRGFLNETPLAIMLTGTMGSKKTTTLTDICLSINAHFRDKALELMLKNEKKFINFPWILLEKDLQARMKDRTIFNLASTRKYIRTLADRYNSDPGEENIFGYNTVDNRLEFDDGLTVTGIWDVIETYAQLYFIYVVEGTYSLSNYSIRFDTEIDDKGNLPLYDNDFFDRQSTYPGDGSTYSHILDFDLLRLGLTVIEDNEKRGSFEFGIVSISEIGKERGNQNDTKEIKQISFDANQKNDLFNDSLKLCRHAATVDNYPFIRFLDDDQRSESLNADGRELHDLINIASTSERQLAMPGFVFEEMVHDILVPRLDKLHKSLRHVRGDKTLTGFILDNLLAAYSNYYDRVYNEFGYYEATLEIENGKRDSEIVEHSYYLSTKKIYSNRFATDCFADFFADRAARAGMGINDYICYRTTRASLDELRAQNSYFIRKLDQITEDD